MKKSISKIIIFNLIILLSSCQSNQNNENIDAFLIKKNQEGKLNGNVLVIKKGKTLYEKSFGYTDGTKNIKLNKNYRFIIGSIYKEFPAVAIMQLQEKGFINLDDKISKHLPELPNWAQKISVKNLLQYSSGLPVVPWDEYLQNGLRFNNELVMKGLKSLKKLKFEPGSNYLYSNNNPILLINIVENITQTSFNEYLKKNVFVPVGMSNTIIKPEYPFQDRTLMTIPFNSDFKEDKYNLALNNLLFASTARDMANWLKKLGDFEVVNKSSVKTLSRKAKRGNNIQGPLGNCDWDNDNIIEHAHHGSNFNYECLVRRFKQDEITIVILTNQKNGNVNEISDEIYKIVKEDI